MSPGFAAAAFPGKHEAERALDALEELQHESVVSLDDAVIVVKTAKGVKLHQQRQVSIGEGLIAGGVLGVIVGLLVGYPVIAPIVGMVLGVVTGVFFDSGIDDARIREIGEKLGTGSGGALHPGQHGRLGAPAGAAGGPHRGSDRGRGDAGSSQLGLPYFAHEQKRTCRALLSSDQRRRVRRGAFTIR